MEKECYLCSCEIDGSDYGKYAICKACRLLHSIPEEVFQAHADFPGSPSTGGMPLANRVSMEILLPLAHKEKWNNAQFASALGLKTNDINRVAAWRRQYAVNLLKMAIKAGGLETLAGLTAEMEQDALKSRRSAFNLAARLMVIAEGQAAFLEKRLQDAQADGKLYDPAEADAKGNAGPDKLSDDIKSVGQLAGVIQRVFDIQNRASGMAQREQMDTAKAGAPKIMLGVNVAAADVPRLTLINPPKRQDKILDLQPDETAV